MNTIGWISIHRQIWDWRFHPLEQNRPFTEFEAFVDMIMLANHDRGVVRRIVVERGQHLTSQVKLATRWRWSRGKVQDFLKDLSTPIATANGEKLKPEISTSSGTQYTLITILNYNTYQSEVGREQHPKQHQNSIKTAAKQQQNSTNNKDKKDNNEKKKVVSAAPLDQFNKWVRENQDTIIEMAKTIQQVSKYTPDCAADRWMRSEIAKMRTWIIGNPEKAKKRWGRFISNWLIKAKDQKASKSEPWRPYDGYMTAAEETAYYAAKIRSGPSSDFCPITEEIT